MLLKLQADPGGSVIPHAVRLGGVFPTRHPAEPVCLEIVHSVGGIRAGQLSMTPAQARYMAAALLDAADAASEVRDPDTPKEAEEHGTPERSTPSH